MWYFCRLWVYGLIDSLQSLPLIFKTQKKPHLWLTLTNLWWYNIVFYLGWIYLLRLPQKYWLSYHSTSLTIFIYLLWIIPQYLISFCYNGYFGNHLVQGFIAEYYPENMELTYGCYSRYSIYLVNKFFYQVIVVLLSIETMLISCVPYLGLPLDWFFTSLIYSYYCWEYSWSSFKVNHQKRYEIFESNWPYYLGYGTLIGLIKVSLPYFESYPIITFLFPIFSMNSISKFRPEKHIVRTGHLKLPLFRYPIRFSEKIMNAIANLVKRQMPAHRIARAQRIPVSPQNY